MSSEARMATRVYRGTSFSKEEIALAVKELCLAACVLKAATQTLDDKFNAEQPVEVKLASEQIQKIASDMASKARQVEALSGSLATVFGSYSRRHAHIGG